jgi:hypothetical protein
MLASILAISWEPELRGLLMTTIMFVVLCGSVYLILATNMGARLGFLVALTGLAGWMALMGSVWWIYGIGLQGPMPSWQEVPGRTVIQDVDSLYRAGVLENRVDLTGDETFTQQSEAVTTALIGEDWIVVGESEPAFGQAAAAAGEFIDEVEAFAPGEFVVTGVFEVGGERYPKIGESLDFLAFFHRPKFALVEVAPLAPVREEPGRAPTAPQIDETRQRQYVYMVRDLGARRQPAAAITIGSSVVFLALCWMLHRRDRIVAENRAAALVPAG